MNKIIYYTKKGKFETDNYDEIPWDNLHAPNDETTALIFPDKTKYWFFEGDLHRLSGPAIIRIGSKWFYLKGKHYGFKDWILNHPNIDIYLNAQNMSESQKAIWKLKNL